MTTGYISFDAFQDIATDAGSSWAGIKGFKSWTGTDKVIQRSKVPSPRAPTAKFAKRTKNPKKAPRPYLGKKPPKEILWPRAPYVSLPLPEGTPSPKPKRPKAQRYQDPDGPYGGRETLRWAEVNRHENSAPKRADSEFHDYDMTLVMRKQEAGSYLIVDNPVIPTYTGGSATFEGWHGLPVKSFAWESSDDYALLGKLRERIAGSDFNALVFLAEGHKALDMIAQNATRIFRAYSHARKGDFVSAARALGVSTRPEKPLRGWSRPVDELGMTRSQIIAKRWLELQYGWLPLLKDVQGGAEFLAHHLNVPLKRRYRVRRKRGGSVTTGSPANSRFTHTKIEKLGQLIAIVSEKDVAQLAGLQDPASVLWETLPFSFVADWFIPIGSWLSARGLASALKGQFITTYTERASASSPIATGGGTIRVPGDYTYYSVNVSRRVTEELLVPLPSSKPLSEALSWKRAANAVALLISAFAGNKRGLRDLTD